MSKSFVLRGALGLVALMVATVAIEGQADAFFKHLRRGGGCGCEAEASCGCAAEVEPSCGCAAEVEEPSCAAPEPSCGAPAECGCGAGAEEPACGAPADDSVPPAPEAPSAAWMQAKPLVG